MTATSKVDYTSKLDLYWTLVDRGMDMMTAANTVHIPMSARPLLLTQHEHFTDLSKAYREVFRRQTQSERRPKSGMQVHAPKLPTTAVAPATTHSLHSDHDNTSAPPTYTGFY